MKLLERVQQLNKNELVCIGSKSAFFFIGYPDDFLKQEEYLSNIWEKKLQSYLKVSIKNVEHHLKDKPNPDSVSFRKMQDIYTGKLYNKQIDYEELLADWDKKHKSLEKTVAYNQKSCDKFKRFAERKVLEEYKSCNGRDNIIICSGNESGTYWLYKEYKKYKGNVL